MKTGIHPDYVTTEVTCTCGNTFTTRSTAPNGVIHVEVCAQCHPFYTGKQKILDVGGRVERFEKRFAKFGGSATGAKAAAASDAADTVDTADAADTAETAHTADTAASADS